MKKSIAVIIIALPTMLDVSMVTYLAQQNVSTEQMTAPPAMAT